MYVLFFIFHFDRYFSTKHFTVFADNLNIGCQRWLNLKNLQIVQIRYHGTVSAAGHDFEKNVRIKHGKP